MEDSYPVLASSTLNFRAALFPVLVIEIFGRMLHNSNIHKIREKMLFSMLVTPFFMNNSETRIAIFSLF